MDRRRRSGAPAAPLALPSPSSSTLVYSHSAHTPTAPPNTPSTCTGLEPALQAAPHFRRQTVLLTRPPQSWSARCTEMAGGTAADCAAVCCCCPCGIINLVAVAVVKVPAGLCRGAFLKKKNNKRVTTLARKVAAAGSGATRRGMVGPRVMDADEDEFVIFTAGGGPVVLRPGAKGLLRGAAAAVGCPEVVRTSPSVEVWEMDKQMWAHFSGTGFWRSPSQKDDV